MTFWSEESFREPLRQNKWFLRVYDKNNDFLVDSYALKECSKPGYEISVQKHRILNNTYNYPGIITWKPITIKFVAVQTDFPELREVPPDKLSNPKPPSPYAPAQTNTTTVTFPSKEYGDAVLHNLYFKKYSTFNQQRGISKEQIVFNSINIIQVDDEGKAIQNWDLKNAFFSNVEYGSLSYANEDLVEITCTITYDWAELSNKDDFNPAKLLADKQKAQEEAEKERQKNEEAEKSIYDSYAPERAEDAKKKAEQEKAEAEAAKLEAQQKKEESETNRAEAERLKNEAGNAEQARLEAEKAQEDALKDYNEAVRNEDLAQEKLDEANKEATEKADKLYQAEKAEREATTQAEKDVAKANREQADRELNEALEKSDKAAEEKEKAEDATYDAVGKLQDKETLTEEATKKSDETFEVAQEAESKARRSEGEARVAEREAKVETNQAIEAEKEAKRAAEEAGIEYEPTPPPEDKPTSSPMSPPSTFGAGGAGAEGAEGSLAEEVRQANEEPKSNADYIREAETDAITDLANSETRQRRAMGEEVSDEQRAKIIERIGAEKGASEESIAAAKASERPADTLRERQERAPERQNPVKDDPPRLEEQEISSSDVGTQAIEQGRQVDAAVAQQARETDAAVAQQTSETNQRIAEGTSKKAYEDAVATAAKAADSAKGGTFTMTQEKISGEEAARRQKADAESNKADDEAIKQAAYGTSDPFGSGGDPF